MKIRVDVAEMLRAGHSDRDIARALHADVKAVAAARKVLSLPKGRPGHVAASSPQDLFRRRTAAAADGHLTWTGHVANNGVPMLCWAGRKFTAYRLAFIMRYGRQPVGQVRPGCGFHGCVAPDHVQDQPMRKRDRAAYAAIFGALP